MNNKLYVSLGTHSNILYGAEITKAHTKLHGGGLQGSRYLGAHGRAITSSLELTRMSAEKKGLVFQKVGIFVDAENIETSGWKHHNGRTDYKKILEAVGDREIIRIIYYKPQFKEISNEFEIFWSRMGGETKRPVKNADCFLIIDAVTMAEKLDVVIILGGDKDYLPLIWYLKSRGCRTEIWAWPEATSSEMQQAADAFFPLTKDYIIPGQTGTPTRPKP